MLVLLQLYDSIILFTHDSRNVLCFLCFKGLYSRHFSIAKSNSLSEVTLSLAWIAVIRPCLHSASNHNGPGRWRTLTLFIPKVRWQAWEKYSAKFWAISWRLCCSVTASMNLDWKNLDNSSFSTPLSNPVVSLDQTYLYIGDQSEVTERGWLWMTEVVGYLKENSIGRWSDSGSLLWMLNLEINGKTCGVVITKSTTLLPVVSTRVYAPILCRHQHTRLQWISPLFYIIVITACRNYYILNSPSNNVEGFHLHGGSFSFLPLPLLHLATGHRGHPQSQIYCLVRNQAMYLF